LVEVFDRMTMQFLVRNYYTMIAAPIQGDVDGISKGTHYQSVPPVEQAIKVSPPLQWVAQTWS
jgi:hypothetical protein